MRGEYKVPGGKLVAAEVEVADGRIASAFVQVVVDDPLT